MSKHAKLFFLLVVLNIFSTNAWSQVWPGDVNNNGEVNALDWVMIQNAIGMFGSPREIAEQGIEWEEKNLGAPWGSNFPGTTIDVSYADANGDGTINFEDFWAIDENFLEQHGVVSTDPISSGMSGIDPHLFFVENTFNPFPEGFTVVSDIFLGTEDIPVSTFSGITFDLVFDPEIVQVISFLGPSGELPDWGNFFLETFQYDFTDENTISIAISTFGTEIITNASGTIGAVFIVIEDDVLGLETEIETLVSIENVILTGDDFGSPSPAVNDSLSITIVGNPLSNDDVLPSSSLQLFPNPISNWVQIESEVKIEQIEIYNTLGQTVMKKEIDRPSLTTTLDLSNLEKGTFVVKVFSDNRFITKKIIIQ